MTENSDGSKQAQPAEMVDLLVLWSFLKRNVSWIAVITLFVEALSVGYLIRLPNLYNSEALLLPRPGMNESSSMGGIASQLSGLAGIAGINFNSSAAVSPTTLAIARMRSLSFFEKYFFEDWVIKMMAVRSWDPRAQAEEFDKSVFDREANNWVGQRPTLQEAHEFYLSTVIFDHQLDTGFVKISATHPSPTIAEELVTATVDGINEYTRVADTREANRAIEFLIKQSTKTNLVSLDLVFSSLIEEQTKKLMLAQANQDYVFQIIQAPVAPEKKSGPARSLSAIGMFFFGLVLAIFIRWAFEYSKLKRS